MGGRVGAPVRHPGVVLANRGYDHDKYRRRLSGLGIATRSARRGMPHGSGLGRQRCIVERTIAWLHGFRRLRIRWERKSQDVRGDSEARLRDLITPAASVELGPLTPAATVAASTGSP
jgi:transposase